jgi:hypothetical protein
MIRAMPDRTEENARIQQQIVEGDLRMSAQIARIEWMIEKDYDPAEARKLLRHMEAILDLWRIRRQLILDALARS